MTRHVTYADFDFTQAGWYRKTKRLAFADVRQADSVETVVTHNSHGVETINRTQPGDYILKGSSDIYGGDGYIIPFARFHDLYEPDPEQNGHYRHTEVRRALLTLEPVTVLSPWHEIQHIGAGGVIIESGPLIHGVDRFSFIQNYARADDRPQHSLLVAMNADLHEQQMIAERHGCLGHSADIQLRLMHSHLFCQAV